MIVSHRITPRKRRRVGLRFIFTFSLTTVMIATGAFGVFPENSVTQMFQQVIGENFPAEFLQPFNAYMEVLSAPTIQPDPDPVSNADSSLDPLGTLVQLFPTQEEGSPTLSQETAVFETAFAILAETQTQIASTLTAEASVTHTRSVTVTAPATASAALTLTSTSTIAPIYYYDPTNTPRPREYPTFTETSTPTSTPTATAILPIILYAGNPSDGNIGPRASADALCTFNPPAGYNNFRAFIAYSAADTLANMPANYNIPTNVTVESPNGTFLAMDWADLMDGLIEQDLNSAGLTGLNWWSGVEDEFGTHIDGVSADCNEWTSNSIADGGNYGDMQFSDATWMDASVSAACDQSLIILCIAY